MLVAGGVVLVARVALPPHGREERRDTHVLTDIAEGLRWVWHHAAVRTLVLTILIFNVTWGAAWSVLVLYATQHLGLGAVGFGLITTVGAIGGLAGIASYGWLIARISLGNLLRIGLIIETLTHLALALTTTAWVALIVFFVFGAHAFVWGTTSITVRQRAVPMELQGRVGSVNLVGVYAGLVVGAAIGGLLAQHHGVTAPFWFAFFGSALFVVLIWGQLRYVAHADDGAGSARRLSPGAHDAQVSDLGPTTASDPAYERFARLVHAYLGVPVALCQLRRLRRAAPAGRARAARAVAVPPRHAAVALVLQARGVAGPAARGERRPHGRLPRATTSPSPSSTPWRTPGTRCTT